MILGGLTHMSAIRWCFVGLTHVSGVPLAAGCWLQAVVLASCSNHHQASLDSSDGGVSGLPGAT